jgi:outer membrane protein
MLALASAGTWLAATGANAQVSEEALEGAPPTSLAEAIAAAYHTNPTLEAERYELRATDESLAQANAELRPTADLQVTGGYSKVVPGRVTQANRPKLDRARFPNIISNTLSAEVVAEQPIYTGGRASANIAAANAEIRAAREGLRGVEGDLLLQTIATYVDVRRDANVLGLRRKNLAQLESTLAEVQARREAGELTRTDIAQAMTQLAAARAQTNGPDQCV